MVGNMTRPIWELVIKDMTARNRLVGLNPDTTYIWDRQLACPVVN
jgi:hypothetical protein